MRGTLSETWTHLNMAVRMEVVAATIEEGTIYLRLRRRHRHPLLITTGAVGVVVRIQGEATINITGTGQPGQTGLEGTRATAAMRLTNDININIKVIGNSCCNLCRFSVLEM